jgi:hypothetical protein
MPNTIYSTDAILLKFQIIILNFIVMAKSWSKHRRYFLHSRKQTSKINCIRIYFTGVFFFQWLDSPYGGLGRLIFRDFTITLFRYTTLGRTPLDEGPARRRDLYLTTHNTHKGQASMPQVEFEPTILVSERTQTHALDRAVTGIGSQVPYYVKFQNHTSVVSTTPEKYVLLYC